MYISAERGVHLVLDMCAMLSKLDGMSEAKNPSGLCETCKHVETAGLSPNLWKCTKNASTTPVEAGLEFVSLDHAKPKPAWCTYVRRECGSVCPDYSEKS